MFCPKHSITFENTLLVADFTVLPYLTSNSNSEKPSQ